MKWEKLPNGKWKPLKEFKQNNSGKYNPDSENENKKGFAWRCHACNCWRDQ